MATLFAPNYVFAPSYQRPCRRPTFFNDAPSNFYDDTYFNRYRSSPKKPKNQVYLLENKNGDIVVEWELPGFTEDEVELHVDNGVLTLQAQNQHCYYYAEPITRQVRLPKEADTERATADLTDSVLTVTFPKVTRRILKVDNHRGERPALRQKSVEQELPARAQKGPALRQKSVEQESIEKALPAPKQERVEKKHPAPKQKKSAEAESKERNGMERECPSQKSSMMDALHKRSVQQQTVLREEPLLCEAEDGNWGGQGLEWSEGSEEEMELE